MVRDAISKNHRSGRRRNERLKYLETAPRSYNGSLYTVEKVAVVARR